MNILNCTVESGVIVGCDESGNSLGASNIGGFAGDFNGTVQNSRCAATVYGENFVGGIIGGKGQALGLCSVTGCVFSGSVVATGNYVGGIAGSGYTGTRWGFTSNAGCLSVMNCLVTGSVQGGDYVGGIQGAEPGVVQCWDNGVGKVTDNLFCGTLTSSGSYTGRRHRLHEVPQPQQYHRKQLLLRLRRGAGASALPSTSTPPTRSRDRKRRGVL